ncbi:hypothetical protein J437_LFUL011142 [Ladona fulva]|uniref:Ig-like domain-containing protein n=1 Tax=Ladona fulva TaxID=123851 RepID=A0A8K0P3T9_LADFU|nr:hypothetical protein J437_LFUL011142 [Ladona fulva]
MLVSAFGPLCDRSALSHSNDLTLTLYHTTPNRWCPTFCVTLFEWGRVERFQLPLADPIPNPPDLKVVDEHGHSVHDRYYKTGSTIELTCRVTNVLVPSHVTWTKDDGPLPAKITSTAISDVTAGESQSRLVVPRATTEDSGTYMCTISEFSFVEVHVHVLNGEKQAAVQHDSWGNSACVQIPKFWLNLFILSKIMCNIISQC